jgi:DNA-binding CsgD family transcriptional regulator/tetratricopeptide (TPR) repeat protein
LAISGPTPSFVRQASISACRGISDTWSVSQIVCPSLVGRDDERAHFVAALDDLGDGRGGLTCVMGEAGIGKSRLVAELGTDALARGLGVLTGRAVDTGTPVPFRPLFEALSGYFRRGGAAEHPELDVIRAPLAQLVPEWRRPGEETYRASPMELGEAILRLLSRIADSRGCVLVLEDLHWADPDTVAVLEYLGDNVGSVPVLCVITLRPEVPSPALRVARELSSRRNATMLELRRLTAAELVVMTQLCLGTEGLPHDVDTLVRRFSDGLPFLVEELLGSAVSAGSLTFGREGWRVEATSVPVIPERFADLIRRRLALLTGDASRTLSSAAVLGPRFDAGLLPIITGQSFEATMEALRRGVAAQLLVADPADPRTFGFRHALTRDALLDQLLPFERVEISRRALAALESHYPELPGSICELAAALAEAVGDRDRTAELLLLAARRAYDNGALSSAEPMLDRAWEFADSQNAAWLEIGGLLMTVLTNTGNIDRALEVGGRLLAETPAPADSARAHLAMARAAASASRWSLATEHVERAREAAVPTSDGSLSAIADAIAAEVAIGEDRFDDAAALARAALTVAERDDDHELASEALLVLGRCARVRGVDDAAAAFDRVIRIGRDHGLPTWGLRGLMERASLDLWNFLPNTRILAARDQAASAGALVVAAHLDNFLAWLARDRWETDQIDEAVDRCVELARKLRLDTLRGVALTAGAVAAAQRGQRDRMDLRIAEALAVSHDHADVVATASMARVTFWLRRDDLSRASTELDLTMDHLRHAPALPVPERGLWILMHTLDERDGDHAIAELDQTFGVNVMNKAYRHYAMAVALGRTGRSAEAARHVTLAEGNQPPLAWYQHHARRLVAEAAIADGWGEPVTWLRDGLDYFEGRGDDQLAGACRTLLVRAGSPVPRRTHRDGGVPPDLHARGVTAREVEVLDLLADARATKDIATQLFLSPKTVERHISNLATKLGLDGRSALVAFAASRSATAAT